jgi:hypothetical protein
MNSRAEMDAEKKAPSHDREIDFENQRAAHLPKQQRPLGVQDANREKTNFAAKRPRMTSKECRTYWKCTERKRRLKTANENPRAEQQHRLSLSCKKKENVAASQPRMDGTQKRNAGGCTEKETRFSRPRIDQNRIQIPNPWRRSPASQVGGGLLSQG